MIRATLNLLTILYACANARLPWDGGPDWDPSWNPFLPLCDPCDGERARYILCCGHVISPAFAAKLIAAGVMEPGEPDRFDRPTITIGDAGRAMLEAGIDRLRRAYPREGVRFLPGGQVSGGDGPVAQEVVGSTPIGVALRGRRSAP